jgi:hypothetical protein
MKSEKKYLFDFQMGRQKFGHHFRKQSFSKIEVMKNCQQ